MASFNQKGVAHVLVLVILVVGLVAGLYLVQHPQIFKPKGYGGPISGPIESPPPISPPISPPVECKSRIGDFSVSDSCDDVENGFRFAKFSCDVEIRLPNAETQGGGKPKCRSIEDWVSIAKGSCKSLCPQSTPTPLPSPIRCAPWEFECDGRCQLRWESCPTSTPTPSPEL